MVKAVIDISLGYSPDLDSNINMGSAIRYITANKGIISSINNVDNALRLPGVKDIYFNKKVGESIDEIKSVLINWFCYCTRERHAESNKDL